MANFNCFLILFLLIAISSANSDPLPASSSEGIMNRIYHAVTFKVPYPPPTAKGIWQTLGQTIRNGFTARIPAILLISNLWKTNSRNNTSKLQYTSVSNISDAVITGESSTSTSILEADDNNNTKVSTNATSSNSPHKIVSAQNPVIEDSCGGNVLMDLTANKVLTYKSTQFPEPQSAPYACSWDVKVSRNCRRGRVTLSVDSRSRLPVEHRCSRGYLRVSPFMKGAKICGEVGTMPPFQWYVDNTQHPPVDADVSIIMKNTGLNDGNTEGVAFTLSGECFSSVMSYEPQLEVSDAKMDNVELSSRWMSALLAESEAASAHHPNSDDYDTDRADQKQHPGGGIRLYSASMALRPVSKLSALASDKISKDDRIMSLEIDIPDSSVNPTDTNKKPTRKFTFYSPLFFILRRFGVL